jgi:LmbE family N-acetylglucosaminyl deacetylase
VASQRPGATDMHPLALDPRTDGSLRVLCLGAHADDIEIGCGGTLLRWLGERTALHLTWAVACGDGSRGEEARSSAQALMQGATSLDVICADLPDARLPAHLERTKAWLEQVRERAVVPDIVLTHRLEDRHQDHRALAEMTWQTWRDHLVLEYEIPKYDGDLGQPNCYVPLTDEVAARKVAHLMAHFGSQRAKYWFRPSTFDGLMALRGVECRAPSGKAEAFTLRKAVL